MRHIDELAELTPEQLAEFKRNFKAANGWEPRDYEINMHRWNKNHPTWDPDKVFQQGKAKGYETSS